MGAEGPRATPRRYYTPAEVATHNWEGDCWVSFLGDVYDLTPLVEEHRGILAKPILCHAGQDISDWFDETVRLHTSLQRRPRRRVLTRVSAKSD
eukprot:scaffold8066_cov403-Prasinococcus_capsulatus_cf.AAC.2